MSGRSLASEPESHALLERFRTLHVPHGAERRIAGEINRSLELAPRDHAFTVLVGPTGVGKTELSARLRDALDARLASANERPDRLAHLYLRLESPEHGPFRASVLDWALLTAAAEPLIDRKQILPRAADRQSGPVLPGTSPARRQAVINVLRIRRPYVVIVDEAQHLTYHTGKGARAALDNFKTLADASDAPFLFIGTYELLELERLSGQLSRRIRLVEFPRYSRDDRTDWKNFLEAVGVLVRHLALAPGVDLLEGEKADHLFVASDGRVGLLKPLLERAYARALGEGRPLSWEDVLTESLPAGKLAHLMAEAEEGERRLREELWGDWSALYEAHGMSSPEREPQGERNSGRRKRQPGQRNPHRDEVGASLRQASA